jgi:hypothetical protein
MHAIILITVTTIVITVIAPPTPNNIHNPIANIARIKYPNDENLRKLIENCKLTNISTLYMQNTTYTYSSGDRQSQIDHVLTRSLDNWTNIKQVNIITDLKTVKSQKDDKWEAANLSDHRPVEIMLEIEKVKTPKQESLSHVQANKKIDWKKEGIKQEYETKLNIEMDKSGIEDALHRISQSKTVCETANQIADLIEAVHTAMLKTAAEINKPVTNAYSKRKRQWSEELTQIRHHKNIQSQCHVNNEDSKIIASHYRNSFRREQRRLCRLEENTNAEDINREFKTDRNKIWKRTSSKTSKPQIIDINMDQLIQHYNGIFGRVYTDIGLEDEISQEINRISQANGDVMVTYESINGLLNKLKSNKATGLSQVTNEMYKHAGRTRMIKILQCILSTIINQHVLPNTFNKGLLSPLLKDNQGSCTDIKNTRPITLSETIDIMVELWLLEDMNERIQTHPLQFGFCKNASVQLAIFTLK